MTNFHQGLFVGKNTRRKMSEWIKCSDRLPDNDDGVIIYSFKDGIGIGSYCIGLVEENRSGWDTSYDWAIRELPTHWRPLPEAPKDD